MITSRKRRRSRVTPPSPADEKEEDNALALRWRAGDHSAYEVLVQRHLDPIHRYVASRIGRYGDADDICQEVFVEVCQKIKNFDPAYPFGAWIFTIAHRKVADHYRRLKPSEEFVPNIHGGEEIHDPALILQSHDGARRAWEEVYRLLPESQATALWLKIQMQMSIRDISVTMEQTESNVKVLLFRARKMLAETWRSPNNIPS